MKRRFFKTTILSLLVLSFSVVLVGCTKLNADPDWSMMDKIIKNMVIPEFRDADYVITDFGAIYDGVTDAGDAIRSVHIEKLTVHEGGRVGIVMEAYEESPIQNVSFKNVKIDNAKTPMQLANIDNITFEDTFINGEKIENR